MRKAFAQALLEEAKKNKDIILITCDLGYGVFDEFRKTLPDQFINVGAAEQAGMGIAVGLALEGKIPFIYSITTFLLYRPFETIRNYIAKENTKVVLCGSGRDFDYESDGWSHHSPDAPQVLSIFPNIIQYYPLTTEEIPAIVNGVIEAKNPSFISLKR